LAVWVFRENANVPLVVIVLGEMARKLGTVIVMLVTVPLPDIAAGPQADPFQIRP
jgi:hypothetical protein